jgi:DNA-binding IclR family transcriptional regulator
VVLVTNLKEGTAREESLPQGSLSTLVRGLRILEFVVRSKSLVRLRDVVEAFELDRSAALRFLRTLEAEGYVSKHEAMKGYSFGPKFLSLPRLPSAVDHVLDAARPVLAELAKATGQMAHLGILHNRQAILVEVIASNAPVAVKQAVGDLESLYSSAVGKAIYAFLPEAERRALAPHIEFIKHTKNTLTDLSSLEAEAVEIRRTGIAFDRNEGNDQITCIGAPIIDVTGRPCAAIGISFVSAHIDGPIDGRVHDIELITRSAEAIRDTLGG